MLFTPSQLQFRFALTQIQNHQANREYWNDCEVEHGAVTQPSELRGLAPDQLRRGRVGCVEESLNLSVGVVGTPFDKHQHHGRRRCAVGDPCFQPTTDILQGGIRNRVSRRRAGQPVEAIGAADVFQSFCRLLMQCVNVGDVGGLRLEVAALDGTRQFGKILQHIRYGLLLLQHLGRQGFANVRHRGVHVHSDGGRGQHQQEEEHTFQPH